MTTPDRQQSKKALIQSTKGDQKSLETVFLIAMKNSVSNGFSSKFVDGINIFNCLSGVINYKLCIPHKATLLMGLDRCCIQAK